MRLTCPNCGAQYEVPDEVIPVEGRDVQCSACGDTWFQAHPDHPAEAAATREPEPEPEPADAPAEAEPRRSPGLDPEIAGILKQEAQREAELRAKETGGGLESQPELGLDDMQDEASRRARQARDRMARLRGDEEAPGSRDAVRPDPDPDPVAGSRRDLLPDIDEINSTLRGTNGKAAGRSEVGPVADAPQRRKSGFARGVMLAVILGLAMMLVYANAGKLAQTVPQARPALGAYVGAVDRARLWLDAKLGQHVPR